MSMVEKRYPPLTDDMLDGLETLAYMGALDYQEAVRHLLAEVRRLRAGLETVRRDHLVTDTGDPHFDWDTCATVRFGKSCDCGADEHNARIDALLSGGG